MIIGIDARLYKESGIGRYIKNLITQLEKIDNENEYIIFVTDEVSKIYHPNNPKFKKWIANYEVYSFQEQLGFVKELYQARLDLLHVPHFNIPLLYTKKFVITLHDLTMHDFLSKKESGLSSHMYEVKKVGYNLTFTKVQKTAKHILVPSETTKNELFKQYKRNKNVTVTYEGVEDSLLQFQNIDERNIATRLESMRIRNRYFLYVGNAYPHKNLENLIISYSDLIKKRGNIIQFVCAGKIDYYSQNMAAFSHGLQLDNMLIWAAKYSESTPYMSDKDIAYLYRGAYAYVFPSLSEGFSITPLEAQSFGVPVLLSDIPVHKEVFGDSVIYFNPNSTIDISDALKKILDDEGLREEYKKRGLENVKKYTWSKLAKETLNIYNQYND